MRSSFDPAAKKGPTMGGKQISKIHLSPGPGSYENHNVISLTKNKGASVKIGTTKRPENFTNSQKDLPGPGNYIESTDTFGKNLKGAATMGSKYKTIVSETPGPGQYSGEANNLKSSKVNCKIGTTKRPDIWAKEAKRD